MEEIQEQYFEFESLLNVSCPEFARCNAEEATSEAASKLSPLCGTTSQLSQRKVRGIYLNSSYLTYSAIGAPLPRNRLPAPTIGDSFQVVGTYL